MAVVDGQRGVQTRSPRCCRLAAERSEPSRRSEDRAGRIASGLDRSAGSTGIFDDASAAMGGHLDGLSL